MRVNKDDTTAEAVLAANKRFYDQIADVYEKVDRRRAPKLEHAWLDDVINEVYTIVRTTFGEPCTYRFLDAGSGSGFLAQKAQKLFRHMILVDLSRNMLDKIRLPHARKIVGDCTHLDLRESTIHCIGAFATLHHLFSPSDFFQEAYRLLKKGGVLYADHDIERTFVRNYRLPLKIYRYFCDHGPRYLRLSPGASARDYELSEFHGKTGLDGESLRQQLMDIGFTSVQTMYHWHGMGPFETLLDALSLKGCMSKRGLAPNLRLLAIK